MAASLSKAQGRSPGQHQGQNATRAATFNPHGHDLGERMAQLVAKDGDSPALLA